jgi:signal transduction histidine kinase
MLEDIFRRVLETGQPIFGLEACFESPPGSGQQRSFHFSYFTVRDTSGQPLGIGGLVLDITDIKRAEQQLREAAEFRERFLGIVTHDLRSPLQAIRLLTRSLAKATDLPERHGQAVKRIAANTDRMARMIDELLDFTRSRLGGGIPLSPREMDLLALLRPLLEEARLTHPGRAIALDAEGRFQGSWDPDRLTQVVTNLMGNALQYSPEETPVSVRLIDAGEQVRLEVGNRGPPISPELLPHLFDPFRRGTEKKASPDGAGLGLGLYIVQQITLAHGGSIDVSSTAQEGTLFRVTLPRHTPG